MIEPAARLKQLAYHEAGHATLGLLAALPLARVVVGAEGGRVDFAAGELRLPSPAREEYAFRRIVMLVSGALAEALYRGEAVAESVGDAGQIDAEVACLTRSLRVPPFPAEAWLQLAGQVAEASLRAHWRAVSLLAGRLVVEGDLPGGAAEELLRRAGATVLRQRWLPGS